MQSRTLRLAWFVACLAIAIPALAQFGYPLKGAWSGEWWLKKGDENRILLEFAWDGKMLSGVLNPGSRHGEYYSPKTIPRPSEWRSL